MAVVAVVLEASYRAVAVAWVAVAVTAAVAVAVAFVAASFF